MRREILPQSQMNSVSLRIDGRERKVDKVVLRMCEGHKETWRYQHSEGLISETTYSHSSGTREIKR